MFSRAHSSWCHYSSNIMEWAVGVMYQSINIKMLTDFVFLAIPKWRIWINYDMQVLVWTLCHFIWKIESSFNIIIGMAQSEISSSKFALQTFSMQAGICTSWKLCKLKASVLSFFSSEELVFIKKKRRRKKKKEKRRIIHKVE